MRVQITTSKLSRKGIVTNALFVKLPRMDADSLIVRRVLAGETDAFARLVDRHHARCLRVATHLLDDADDAEDAVQDAFVRAYRHLGSYREQDRFGAWLLRIVVNQCRTRAAKQARYTRLGDHGTSSPSNTPRSHDLVAQTDQDAQRAELAHALAQLGAEQREAIVLRFAEELSYDEMASMTGVGVSALKMRVQRACAALRSLLTEQFHA
jgi:RNA polymerase sigma-70 factor (ECF subfamily)